MKAIGLAALLAALAATSPAAAQRVGDRVRILEQAPRLGIRYTVLGSRLRFSDRATDTGTIAAINADTILLATDRGSDTVAILMPWITRLDVSRGTESNILPGIGLGAASGLGVGLLVGAIVGETGGGTRSESSAWMGAAGPSLAAATGVAVGVLIGGVIGALTSGERWEESAPGRLRFGAAPNPTGLALSLSIRF